MDDSVSMSDIRELYTWLDERMNQLGANQREQHARLRQDMQTGFQGVNARLDTLNGKTNAHESQIAVLKDRSERAEDELRTRQRQVGMVGSITGGGGAAIVMLIKAWLTK